MLAVDLSLTSALRGGGWSPAALFAGGLHGYWMGGCNPADGRLFVSETTPANLPGELIYQARRAAGTIDPSPSAAPSRPTLGRWPKGGRANLLNALTDVPTLGANWGVTGGTMIDGVLTDNSSGTAHNTFGLGTNVQGLAGVAVGTRVYVSHWVGVLGDTTAVQIAFGSSYFGNGAYANFDLINGTINATGCNATMVPDDGGWRLKADALTTLAAASGAPFALCLTNNNMAAGRVPNYVGIGRQVQWGKVQVALADRPYQNVISQYDITEAGKPDVWHLSNDGGDSLPVTLPAGLYGRAWVDATGVISVDTVTDPANAYAAPMVAGATQVDAILRQGAFTSAEVERLSGYWGQYA